MKQNVLQIFAGRFLLKDWTSSYKVCYNNIVWCILLSRGSFPGK